ncbi:MAG: hypothetical protein WBB39_01845 [Candidatus Saccharimonadales bacterium]
MDYRRYIEYQTFVPSTLVWAFGAGLLAGGLTWLLMLGSEKYVVGMVLCANGNTACGAAPTISILAALIVAHFLGLIMLIRAIVMRPLLVILASIASVWGFQSWLGGQSWWMASLMLALLFGLAYALYAWINRLLFFPLALALTIATVVGARLLLMTW